MTLEHVIHETPAKQHRFHLLDALRGIAAVMVVVYHAQQFGFPDGPASGFLAVDFFFCLSGFVIAFSYERRLQQAMSWGQFAVARLIRLYPVFLLGSVLGLSVFLVFDQHHVHYPLGRLWMAAGLQVSMIPNYTHPSLNGGIFPFDHPAWSLFFELLANGVYAFLVRKRLANRWCLGILLLVCFGLAARLAFMDRFNLGIGVTWEQARMALYRVGLSFLLGVLALRLYRKVPHTVWSNARSAVCGFAIVVVLLLSLQLRHSTALDMLDVTLLFPVMVFAGAFVVVPKAWVSLCVFLGDVSYPLYLLHIPLLKLTTAPVLLRMSSTHRGFAVGLLTVAVLIIIAFSHLTIRYYDEPARKWLRKRYSASRTPQVVASG